MRSFCSSRLFRILFCLVLICRFLVNSSPIKAKASLAASFAAAAFGTVAVEIAMVGSSSSAFNQAVNECVTYLKNATTFVVDGAVTVLGFMTSEDTRRSFFQKAMIQAVWQWSFDNTVVIHAPCSTFHSYFVQGRSFKYFTSTQTFLINPLFLKNGLYICVLKG